MTARSCDTVSRIGTALAAATAFTLAACNEFLSSPAPTTVIAPGALTGRQGAEALRAGVIIRFNNGFAGRGLGVAAEGGLLADEFTSNSNSFGGDPADQRLQPDNLNSPFRTSDQAVKGLQAARLQAELAIPVFRRNSFHAPDWEFGQLLAIEGYTELLIAEHYCAGTTLSTTDSLGHIVDGVPLTADSVYALAVSLFDSALVHASDSVPVAGLAYVGRARALLDRGNYAAADSSLLAAPAAFVYTADFDPRSNPSIYGSARGASQPFTMSDREGTNGLPFISSGDPRTASSINTSPFSSDTVRLPLAFGPDGTPVPVASSIEAQLIRAEAALARGDVTAWLDTLNVLRTSEGGVPGLTAISDPGTPAARVDTMFTERAYWMFGTAHRVGDLRRLIRQYGRAPETVFPTGPYLGPGGGTYGPDVNFPFPLDEHNNPNFHGCLSRSA